MTDIVARAEKLLKAATPGPWRICEVASSGYQPHYGVSSEGHNYPNVVFAQCDWEGYGNGSRRDDAEFIAASPTLVAELIAEVERLRGAT